MTPLGGRAAILLQAETTDRWDGEPVRHGSAWTVDQVYADPCHWQAGVLGSAPGEQDLATRLRNEAGRDASAPTEVSLGGVPALRIELSTPTRLDIASCDRGEFRSWSEWDVDRANSHNAPGQLDVVYVVDVDRRPLVIDASHMPAASKQDLRSLRPSSRRLSSIEGPPGVRPTLLFQVPGPSWSQVPPRPELPDKRASVPHRYPFHLGSCGWGGPSFSGGLRARLSASLRRHSWNNDAGSPATSP